MKVIEYFPRAYVINLPERTDRRRMIMAQLEKPDSPLTPDQVEFFAGIRPDDPGEFKNIGIKGCFLSHLAILKKAKEDNLPNILILEDDLGFSPQFKPHQDQLIEQLSQSNWGFVYFGHRLKLEATDTVKLIPYSRPIETTHCYGVNAVIFDRLIEFLEGLLQRPAGHPDGGPMFIDGALSTFRRKNPDVFTWVASPTLGIQQSSRSDLTTNRWDRISFVRPVMGMLRTIKNQISSK
ncbi:glycosyltransferase family 25 protein [Capilliphycus salinus ALCB114379]|uniref:glycosyltransferase family 25 protein n=1 Tax=Capilliphycus salinus TaxID=2768948 RepID=UPI0039A54B23